MTDAEERGGTLILVETLAVAVSFEDTHGNRLDLDNFAELFKPGKVVKHGGLFRLPMVVSMTTECACESEKRKLKS